MHTDPQHLCDCELHMKSMATSQLVKHQVTGDHNGHIYEQSSGEKLSVYALLATQPTTEHIKFNNLIYFVLCVHSE